MFPDDSKTAKKKPEDRLEANDIKRKSKELSESTSFAFLLINTLGCLG